jgi:transposase
VPDKLDDGELERRLFTPASSLAQLTRPQPEWPQVHGELKRRGVTLLLLWGEYRALHGDRYGYSRFCDLYRGWRGTISPTMRQTRGPGEKLFANFAGDTVPVVDGATGELRQAQNFVAALGVSDYVYARACWTQSLPEWIAAHVGAFAAIGGVAKALVCDDLKAGVTATVLLPARSRRPRDKAKVDRPALKLPPIP